MTEEHEIITIAKELIAYSGNPVQLLDKMERLQIIAEDYALLKAVSPKQQSHDLYDIYWRMRDERHK